MSKQDKQGSRTAADVERRYLINLHKSFAEVEGVSLDAREQAVEAEKKLSEYPPASEIQMMQRQMVSQGLSLAAIVRNGEVRSDAVIEAINKEKLMKIRSERLGKFTAAQVGEGLKNGEIPIAKASDALMTVKDEESSVAYEIYLDETTGNVKFRAIST